MPLPLALLRSGCTRVFVAGLLAGTLASFAAVADAKDFCLDDTGTPDTNLDFVLEKFVAPKAGKCRAFVGRGITTEYGATALQGVGCTAIDGGSLTFQMTLATQPDLNHFITGKMMFYAVRLALPALQGHITRRESADTTVSGDPARGFTCVGKVVP